MVCFLPGLGAPREERELSPIPVSHPGHEDLFSCCQRKNFRGVPSSFFAIHITAALVLFMTDGLTVSLPSEGAPHGAPPEPQVQGWREKGGGSRFPRDHTSSTVGASV